MWRAGRGDAPRHGFPIALLAAVTVLASACGLAGAGPDTAPTPESALLGVEISRIPTPQPSPTPIPTLRTDCAAILGSSFRSDAERAWFAANCNAATQAPATTVQVAPTTAPLAATVAPVQTRAAGCVASVTVTADFPHHYYEVSGTTMDAINTSIYANAPPAPGGVAGGLTEYRLAISSGRCVGSNVCALGATVLGAIGSVTLPRHNNEASIPADVRTTYKTWADGVTVHEERHVTITTEGLEEAKRKLLALPTFPNCDALDRAVNDIWRDAVSAIDLRQEAFHIADRYGAGGSVVQ